MNSTRMQKLDHAVKCGEASSRASLINSRIGESEQCTKNLWRRLNVHVSYWVRDISIGFRPRAKEET